MIVSQWVFIFSGPTSKMYQTLILINSLSIYFWDGEIFRFNFNKNGKIGEQNFICTLNKLDFSNYLQKFKHWFGKQFF